MLNIRKFRSGDLDALYRISLATGFVGDDASHLYADPRLIGHIYAAPYALLEPQLALVVEGTLQAAHVQVDFHRHTLRAKQQCLAGRNQNFGEEANPRSIPHRLTNG